jgi:hypothetical protein
MGVDGTNFKNFLEEGPGRPSETHSLIQVGALRVKLIK